ncbi:MAG: transcriptional regulator [Gammaproteobacteria bacterium]|nr:transcriptional regulator [Gammaproteobacteria bacterium]
MPTIFHNLGGGYVVLGVEELDGRPVLPPRGIDPNTIDGIQKEMLNLGNSAIQPPYHPLTAVHEIDGKTILVLYAPGGETRPYRTRVSLSAGNREWAYHIRKHSSTVRARGGDERELLGLAATVPFDDRYNQNASLDDLSFRLIQQHLQDVGSDLLPEVAELSMEALGRRMNIVGGPSEAVFPKNVGLLFFNDRPHEFFPATQIDVVWFPDGPGGDNFEEKEFRGPLAAILRDAISYIEGNYLKQAVVKHADRPEADRFWNFPVAAIEEALGNAIYHRSYEEREPVEVRITREELLVLSYPGADRSIRMEDLRRGQAVSRRYRNRRIGEFLKELDLAEGRSTGVPKILRAMHNNGSPAPSFETDDDRTWFRVRLPAHTSFPAGAGDASGLQDTEQDNPLEEKEKSSTFPQDTPQDTHQDPPQVTEGVAHLIGAIQRESSRAELQAALNLRDRRSFIDTYLRPALEAGLIEMTLPDKPTSRNQRYRRTSAGEALARQLAEPGK